MSEKPLRIAIVGGGIAGLATAAGLVTQQKRHGANVEIRIYEQAPRFGEIGAGVSIGPNGERALRLIGAPQEHLVKLVKENDPDPSVWFDFHVGQRDHPQSKAFICAVTNPDKDSLNVNIHRADFLDSLIKLIPADVAQFNRHCTSYTPHADGVTLHFDAPRGGDPASKPVDEETDILIASDGVKSRLRAHMFRRKNLPLEKQAAKYAEWVAWRGLIPREKLEEAFGKGCQTKMMHLGRGRHILHFPVRGAKLINIVAFVQDPKHEKLGNHTGPWAEDRPASEMLEDFKDFTDECKTLLRAIEKPSIWGIFSGQPIEENEIVDERVVLLGDAAHATTPHQGSGAGQCLEDAAFIAHILVLPEVTSARGDSDKLTRALKVYAKHRHDRGIGVQKTSRDCGLLYEMQGPDGEGEDVAKIAANLTQRLRWIWEFDTQAELDKALDETRSAVA